MNPFITYRDVDENGELQYYILQRAFPHYVGILSSNPLTTSWQSPIAGYHLNVVYAGTIRGNVMPIYRGADRDILLALEEMANWYYHNRIIKEPGKYKKFKVATDV